MCVCGEASLAWEPRYFLIRVINCTLVNAFNPQAVDYAYRGKATQCLQSAHSHSDI